MQYIGYSIRLVLFYEIESIVYNIGKYTINSIHILLLLYH